eukprot:scaffold171834_cov33-Attheya_sp.AAC.1
MQFLPGTQKIASNRRSSVFPLMTFYVHLPIAVYLTNCEGPKLSYLNLEIHQTEHYISIDQTAHIREIVQEWFPDEAELRTTDTPFRTDNEYEPIISEALPAEPAELIDLERQYGGPYRTSLGKFQHVKEWTRPDLSYATSRL